MEIIKKQLVANIQNDEYLQQYLIMNTIENNETNGAVVIEIIDINNKQDVYATLYNKINTSLDRNQMFTINRIIFEEKLSQEMIKWILNMVFFALLPCDNLTRHYLITNNRYSYICKNEKEDIIKQTISEILQKLSTNIDDYLKTLYPDGIKC